MKHELETIDLDAGHGCTMSYIASKLHPGMRLQPTIQMPTAEFLETCDPLTTVWPTLEWQWVELKEAGKKKPKAPMEPLAVVGEKDLFGHGGLEEVSLLGISQPDPTAAALPQKALPEGALGFCTSCKSPVYPKEHQNHKEFYVSTVKNGQYYRHKNCVKVDNAFRAVSELLSPEVQGDLAAAGRESKLKWYHEHNGIVAQMAAAVTATFTQQRQESKNFIATKKGIAMTDEQLTKEYWDKNRPNEYRSIKANAETFVCPVAGTKFWFVPQYEMEDRYTSSQTGTQQQMASQLQNHKAAAKRQALTPEAAAARAQRVSRKSAEPKAAAAPPAKFEAQAQKFITTYLAPLKAKFNMAVADDERMKNLLPDLPKGSEALAKKAMLWADGSEADIKKILSEEAQWPEGYTLKQFFDEAKDEYNEHDQQLHSFVKALDYAEDCQGALQAEAELESRRSSAVAASPARELNLT
jgi:hypothetical protein